MNARIEAHIARLKASAADWPLEWADVEALARSEDCRLVAYQCVAGQWTIAWGETAGVKPGMRCTEEWADKRFTDQVRGYTQRVQDLLTTPANAHQLGAFVRLAYNIGLGAFAKSTALRKHNAGAFDSAARAIGLWDKITDPATGAKVTSRGLTARRALERARYLEPLPGAPREPMPQAVEPESGMASSPIVRGTATAGGAAVALASTALEQGKAIADKVADFVGLPWQAVLAGVIIAGAIVAMKMRKKQRDDGWA